MVAILVSYRDRPNQLQTFSRHMGEYADNVKIYVIEQEEGRLFNRGKLFNVGFDLFQDRHDTFVFHDVDMVPVDAKYEEVQCPTHLCGSASQFDDRGGRPYDSYFGGVTAFDKQSFRTINGFSNEYWGWGAEDDDLRERCHIENLNIDWKNYRFRSLDEGSLSMGIHKHKKLSDNRKRLRKLENRNGYDHQKEGLNSLDYSILKSKEGKNYDQVKVSI